MARKKKETAAIVAVTIPFDVQVEPVPQPMPLDDRMREWRRRQENYNFPYHRQNIGQRIYGEVVKYHLDPIWMTDAGVNVTSADKTYLTSHSVAGKVPNKTSRG